MKDLRQAGRPTIARRSQRREKSYDDTRPGGTPEVLTQIPKSPRNATLRTSPTPAESSPADSTPPGNTRSNNSFS